MISMGTRREDLSCDLSISASLESQAGLWLDAVGSRFDAAVNSLMLDFDNTIPGTNEQFTVRLLQPNEVLQPSASIMSS